MVYQFTFILASLDDALVESLFEAGCDDGSPGVCNGVPQIDFDREAPCWEDAIRSAAADVRKGGGTIKRLVVESDSPLLVG